MVQVSVVSYHHRPYRSGIGCKVFDSTDFYFGFGRVDDKFGFLYFVRRISCHVSSLRQQRVMGFARERDAHAPSVLTRLRPASRGRPSWPPRIVSGLHHNRGIGLREVAVNNRHSGGARVVVVHAVGWMVIVKSDCQLGL